MNDKLTEGEVLEYATYGAEQTETFAILLEDDRNFGLLVNSLQKVYGHDVHTARQRAYEIIDWNRYLSRSLRSVVNKTLDVFTRPDG